ncbi:Uncharacterized protein GBIM_02385, partial [Gryllus bimaculatus]
VGAPVYRLRGADPEGARVAYSVSGEWLAVQRDSGVVTLRRPLDRETQGLFEPNTVSLRREVAVLDVNDNAPEFLGRPYALALAETTPVGSDLALNISVADADGGVNSDVEVTCDHAPGPAPADHPCSVFAVHTEKVSEGLFGVRVTLARALDFERQAAYQVPLRAVDGAADPARRLSATAALLVDVLDVQDQPPRFLNAPFSATLAEGAPPVTIIVTDVDDQMPSFNQKLFHINVSEDIGSDTPLPGLALVAEDRDVGENARFRLRLRAAGAAEGAFAVLPTAATGRVPVVIKVVDAAALDYDADAARVEVALLDANDHAPHFERASYRVAVREDAAPGAPVAAFVASDADSGAFGRVEYALRGFGAEAFL